MFGGIFIEIKGTIRKKGNKKKLGKKLVIMDLEERVVAKSLERKEQNGAVAMAPWLRALSASRDWIPSYLVVCCHL